MSSVDKMGIVSVTEIPNVWRTPALCAIQLTTQDAHRIPQFVSSVGMNIGVFHVSVMPIVRAAIYPFVPVEPAKSVESTTMKAVHDGRHV